CGRCRRHVDYLGYAGISTISVTEPQRAATGPADGWATDRTRRTRRGRVQSGSHPRSWRTTMKTTLVLAAFLLLPAIATPCLASGGGDTDAGCARIADVDVPYDVDTDADTLR